MVRSHFVVAVVVSLMSLAPALARADACSTGLYSTCINDDNLWPHAGSSHFLTVGGTETAPRGEVSFGLYTTYLSRPIVLQSDSGEAARPTWPSTTSSTGASCSATA